MNTTPAAIDSPAEPIVCTMLFSRIVERPNARKTEIDSTAIGIDADTVRPTFSARYTVEAPNRTPNKAPKITALAVNSAGASVAGTNGSNSAGSGGGRSIGSNFIPVGVDGWCGGSIAKALLLRQVSRKVGC